ncbi:hypothetical protein FF100_28420 [Methylobacterium terricola]|uniref:Uncharacterized protein n=1 Tax=Methylobacterium terricola TaxID=2583531 RepID=A0A5C4L8P0_9HYPH|nr:hypothetical protein [Methylobacterium terricola]TNC08766.1 hypothetical protein FF100_28420 [Methylobacterium terricola]
MADKDVITGTQQNAWFINFEDDGPDVEAASFVKAVKPSGPAGSEPPSRNGEPSEARHGNPSPSMVNLLMQVDVEQRNPRSLLKKSSSSAPKSQDGHAHSFDRTKADRGTKQTNSSGSAIRADINENEANVPSGGETSVKIVSSDSDGASYTRRGQLRLLVALAAMTVTSSVLVLNNLERPTVSRNAGDSLTGRLNLSALRGDQKSMLRGQSSLAMMGTTAPTLPPTIIFPLADEGVTTPVTPTEILPHTVSVDQGLPRAAIQTVPTALPPASSRTASIALAPTLTPMLDEPATQVTLEPNFDGSSLRPEPSVILAEPLAAPNSLPSDGEMKSTHGGSVRSGSRWYERTRKDTVEENQPRSRERTHSRRRLAIKKPVQTAVADPAAPHPSVTRLPETTRSMLRHNPLRNMRTTSPKFETPRVAQAERATVFSLPTVLRPTPF